MYGPRTAIINQIRVRHPEECWLGEYSIIDDFCYIAVNLHIGDYSHIGSNCSFLGSGSSVDIGDFVNIATGCRFVCAGHDYKYGGLNGPAIPEEYRGHSTVGNIKLRDHVLIGCNSVILPGVFLPEGVAIGALSLVKPGIYRPWTLYAGIPAVEIGPRYAGDILQQAKRLINVNNCNCSDAFQGQPINNNTST